MMLSGKLQLNTIKIDRIKLLNTGARFTEVSILKAISHFGTFYDERTIYMARNRNSSSVMIHCHNVDDNHAHCGHGTDIEISI